jgi:hypothetical protein
MGNEIDRARKALDDTERKLSRLESKWESSVAADDDASADAALPVVIRCRDERDRATTRLRAATDAFSSVDANDDDNIDPLLDFVNGLRRELSGRVNSATDMKRLNAVVREFFSEVVLTATDNGVLVAPYLHADAVERVLGERGLASDADGFPDDLNIGHPPPLRALHAPSDNPRPF